MSKIPFIDDSKNTSTIKSTANEGIYSHVRQKRHLKRESFREETYLGFDQLLDKMSTSSELLEKKMSVIQEQLKVLCGLKKLQKGNEEFAALLKDEFHLKSLLGYSEKMISVCYYLLGIIDCEERDKLIQWPLINIKTRTKFRKGVAAFVRNLQIKYPWAHIIRIPESYFMNPQGMLPKAIDFLLRLTNLAIHISLDDPEILTMHSGNKVSANDIVIMTEVISRAKEKEEEKMKKNLIPYEEIEGVKNYISHKCITLIQLNNDLQQQLNALVKYAYNEKLITAEQKIDIEEFKKIKDEMLSELSSITEELSKYYNESKIVLSKIKALKNPKSLCAKDFGCKNLPPDLIDATSRVCGDLCQVFQYVASKSSTRCDEESFYKQLKEVNKVLAEHNKEMSSFLHQMGTGKAD